MPVFTRQTLGSLGNEKGDAVNAKYRRLLRVRQRIREYETLLNIRNKAPHIHARIELLARKLQHETRNQSEIDEELHSMNQRYRTRRRESWKHGNKKTS